METLKRFKLKINDETFRCVVLLPTFFVQNQTTDFVRF